MAGPVGLADLARLSLALRASGLKAQIKADRETAFLKIWHPLLVVAGVCVEVRMTPGPDGEPEAWFGFGDELLAPCSDLDRATDEILRALRPILAIVEGRT
ncbi:hypothetical protein LO762_22500 [Actinocorallia sp. API 0066]|uniref:hypothetical protein n=1 Tax=Actinocorallia sp. API 0066 TaxID=2896846 RepID=UPI001E59AFC0|nr:hypothetical protein [Actinocorallia sp. API 0066]MCD0451943.1 hypothetical protein [Actinocorallia sp. API 0066]